MLQNMLIKFKKLIVKWNDKFRTLCSVLSVMKSSRRAITENYKICRCASCVQIKLIIFYKKFTYINIYCCYLHLLKYS